ncbi:MAG: 50S ribosomal protein L30 [Spirochaetales bacterium]|nr:50S ribosomal protein L30 [Spirochaetales bacterium]
MKAKKIKIRLKRSTIGSLPFQRKTVKALGLNKVNSEVIHNTTPSILGMVNAVSHMIEVEEIK